MDINDKRLAHLFPHTYRLKEAQAQFEKRLLDFAKAENINEVNRQAAELKKSLTQIMVMTGYVARDIDMVVFRQDNAVRQKIVEDALNYADELLKDD